MEMIVDFPGGARVDAHFGPYTVKTDQPGMAGGEAAYPTPFALFLASLATCAGIYILGFCRQRGLPVEDIRIVQRDRRDPLTGMVAGVDMEIQVPEDFPPKYYDALVRSAEMCAVKKHLENPPEFKVSAVLVEVAETQ